MVEKSKEFFCKEGAKNRNGAHIVGRFSLTEGIYLVIIFSGFADTENKLQIDKICVSKCQDASIKQLKNISVRCKDTSIIPRRIMQERNIENSFHTRKGDKK